MRCIGTWPGPFVHDLDVVLPGDARQLALGLQLGELRLVVGVGDRSRAQAVAEREADVVGAHDLADLAEARVEEAFLVMREAPLRDDRAAARDDAGDAPGGHRDVAQQHAGVDGEVVHALLGLLDQRVAIDLPGQLLGPAADFLERLIDRHRADRHGRVADDPLARLVDVACRSRDPSTVSAPHSVAQRSFSTSSSIDEVTAELPMLALIFTRKLRPMIIGSSSG